MYTRIQTLTHTYRVHTCKHIQEKHLLSSKVFMDNQLQQGYSRTQILELKRIPTHSKKILTIKAKKTTLTILKSSENNYKV